MKKWEICCNCGGEGAHSKRLGVINVDEWDQDSLDDYMNGGYDQVCEVCNGTGKVLEGENRAERYYATDEEYYWKREGLLMQTIEILDDAGMCVGREWRCVCGGKVESYMGHDVDCPRCGQLFNAWGQRLNPPSQWGEGHDY